MFTEEIGVNVYQLMDHDDFEKQIIYKYGQYHLKAR